MAVDGVTPALAIRSSVGVELWMSSGLKCPYEHRPELPRELTKIARAQTFSADGRFYAYTNGTAVVIYSTEKWQQQCTLPRPKAFYLKFSPRGNYLATWELYTTNKDEPNGSNNMYIFNSETGQEVYSIIQKKQSEWEPCWSSNESLFALMIGGEAVFYDLTNNSETDFKKRSRTMGGGRGGVLSIGPGNNSHVAFYTPGDKGGPSMCKLYKYPSIQLNQQIACKSFFQCDRIEMLWNKRGTGLLLLTSTEVDKTGASYYGNQTLYLMTSNGDSCSVSLKKEGPIHAVEWSPNSNEFIVIYGYMPSKATLFNSKSDAVFNFGEGPRNSAYFNKFGNLLILGGFGNLRGTVEVWDMKARKSICSLEAPDSTYLEWCPNGEFFVTATTAPRLRTSNGFKVWHYSGALLHETLWPTGQELLAVEWQKFAEGFFKENSISYGKVEGIKSSQPEASKAVYQPPNVRLMKKGMNPDSIPQPSTSIPGLPPGYSSKNKRNPKQRKQKQKKNQDETVNDEKSNDNVNDIVDVGSNSLTEVAKASNTTAGKGLATAANKGSTAAIGKNLNTASGKGSNITIGKGSNAPTGKGSNTTVGKGSNTNIGKNSNTASGKGSNPSIGKGSNTPNGPTNKSSVPNIDKGVDTPSVTSLVIASGIESSTPENNASVIPGTQEHKQKRQRHHNRTFSNANNSINSNRSPHSNANNTPRIPSNTNDENKKKNNNSVNRNNDPQLKSNDTKLFHYFANGHKLLMTGDALKDKKLKLNYLYRRLNEIASLRKRETDGEVLNSDQILKIQKEGIILEELKTLKISSS